MSLACLDKFKIVERRVGNKWLAIHPGSSKEFLSENLKGALKEWSLVTENSKLEEYTRNRKSMREEAWFMGYLHAGGFVTRDSENMIDNIPTGTDTGIFFRGQKVGHVYIKKNSVLITLDTYKERF